MQVNNFFCGVDFGTSNCSAAVWRNGQAEVVKLDNESKDPRVLCSKIYINYLKECLVGQAAVNRFLSDLKTLPARAPQSYYTGRQIQVIKEASGNAGFAGTKLVPEIVEVDTTGRGQLLQSLKSVLASTLYTGTEINVFQNNVYRSVKYSLEDLLVMLMKTIKTKMEGSVETTVAKAVIGRPVRYVGANPDTELALRRMKSIAKKAGFEEVIFEYEPVGAALSYGVNIYKPGILLVFDFGGGTLDICVMKLPEREILSVAGRPIGGDLLNAILFVEKLGKYFGTQTTFAKGRSKLPEHWKYAMQSWFKLAQLKTLKNLESLENLGIAADDKQPIMALEELIMEDLGFPLYQKIDAAKVSLSGENSSQIVFDAKKFHINEVIRREEFEELISAEVEETRRCIEESLSIAKVKTAEIDYVVTTGGSSSIPIFQNLLFEIFGKDKVTIGDSYTAVAAGMAIRAGELFKK